MSFGANLEKMRRKLGKQIFELERYCGIPKERLSAFESGQANPTLTEVLALSYVFSTTPQELLDMQVPAKKAAPKQTAQAVNPENNEAAPKAAVKTEKIPDAYKNPKDVSKQNKKKKENKAEEPWSEDDVTAALMQLQVGTNNIKEQNATSSGPMNSAQLQQQAMAHAANSPAKTPKEKKPAQTVQATTPGVTQQKVQTNEKVDAQVSTKSFAEKMKEARVKLNLSYPKICKNLGIRTIEYVQIETGAVQPSEELKEKICKLFQIN